MTTREAFLSRVRTAEPRAAPPVPAEQSARPADPERAARECRTRALGRCALLLERFEIELVRVGGAVHRVPDVGGAARRLVELCRKWGARSVVTWAAETVPVDMNPLRGQGLSVQVGSPMSLGPGDRARLREAVAGAAVGVTGADFAVAETGSLVLLSGAGQGRGVSLLPPYHVAIFGKHALVETLSDLGVHLEALHRGREDPLTGSAVQIITGPSRTADIEQTLSRGVHGPREVHAIFVDSL